MSIQFRKILLSAALIGLAAAAACAQMGKPFPSVTVQKLSEESLNIPQAFAGSYALVGIATSKRAEEDLKTWQAPIYNKFIRKNGLMDDLFDVQVAFIPLFTGASRVAKDKVVKELRKNNESLVLDHLYIYAGDRKPFADVNLGEKDEPQIVLLDASGKIIWVGEGAFKQQYFDQIEALLTE